jgi:hypothetical protein
MENDFTTARQAEEMSLFGFKKKVKEQLDSVFLEIREASREGGYYVHGANLKGEHKLYKENVELLLKLGYKIEYNLECLAHIIKWEVNYEQ